MNSDSVEEILVKYSTKIIRTKKDLHHAKASLDREYTSKFIELIEDSMPQGSYHVNTETLLAKIKKHFNV